LPKDREANIKSGVERDRIEKLAKASSRLAFLKRLAIRVGIPLLIFFAGVFAMAIILALNSQNDALANANSALSNKEIQLDKATGEIQDRSTALTSQQERDQQTDELLQIFDDLSKGKGNKQAIAQLNDLVAKGGVPDDLKKAFRALAPSVVKGPELAEVQKILGQTQVVSIPRVYIQFLDPQQQTAADDVVSLLKEAKLTVPKVQQIANVNLVKTQVRYFYDTDKDLATTVANLLSAAKIPKVQAKFVPGYENQRIPEQQLEVWFANDAMSRPATILASDKGFCDLRSTPDTKSDSVQPIPSGAEVQVQICRTDKVSGKNAAGRDVKGQWCRVKYNGSSGWIFDAWLDDSDRNGVY